MDAEQRQDAGEIDAGEDRVDRGDLHLREDHVAERVCQRADAFAALAQQQALLAGAARLADADDGADHHADDDVDHADAEEPAGLLQLRGVRAQPVDDHLLQRFGVRWQALADPRGQRGARARDDVGHARQQRRRACALASQERRGGEAGGDQGADNERADQPDAQEPRARRAAADEGDARRDGVHQLVHQQSGEQRADQPEMKAEREADERRRDGGVAGLALREDGRRGQGAMMA